MDVLYVVGRGSRHGNAELRWSLRSLERHGKNLGRVVVAGYPPDWLRNALALPVPDTPGAGKHANILNCILEAVRRRAVAGEFLYSSDDHVLVRDSDLDAWRQAARAGEWRPRAGGNRWARSVDATRALLADNGYPTVRFDMHRNSRLRAAEAAEAGRLARLGGDAYGYEPTDLFLNVRLGREPWMRLLWETDAKLNGQDNGRAWLDRAASERDTVSFGDGAFGRGDGFEGWMEGRFPEPSKFEEP